MHLACALLVKSLETLELLASLANLELQYQPTELDSTRMPPRTPNKEEIKQEQPPETQCRQKPSQEHSHLKTKEIPSQPHKDRRLNHKDNLPILSATWHSCSAV